MIPTETPHGTRSRVEPSSRANERPSVRSSASRIAISSAPLDIRWPLKGFSASATPGASTTVASAGMRWRRMTSTAPSTYSGE
jgi:hypothetical protein